MNEFLEQTYQWTITHPSLTTFLVTTPLAYCVGRWQQRKAIQRSTLELKITDRGIPYAELKRRWSRMSFYDPDGDGIYRSKADIHEERTSILERQIKATTKETNRQLRPKGKQEAHAVPRVSGEPQLQESDPYLETVTEDYD